MNARVWFWSVALPLALACFYPIGVLTLSNEQLVWYWSESGPIEWLTAFVFLLAGLLALRLFLRTPGQVPQAWRMFYLSFAIGGFVMCGEELSWAQHVLRFETPDVLVEHNVQGEANLHNLFDDDPSRIARRFAEIGLPILLGVIPLMILLLDKKKQAYTPGHWPYYLLPRFEAVPALILAAICRPVGRLDHHGHAARLSLGVGELAELFWAVAVLTWVVMVAHRLLHDHTGPTAQCNRAGAPPMAATGALGDD